MDSGHVLEYRKSPSFCFWKRRSSGQCPRKRQLPELGSLPLKSGANAILAGSLHSLASNMQLSDYRDYLRGNFKDFNIVDFLGDNKCKRVEYVDIRGHNGTNLTAPFWQRENAWMLHILSRLDSCEFSASVGAVVGEDNFGFYGEINQKFRCTQADNSTTQWWFGAHLKK